MGNNIKNNIYNRNQINSGNGNDFSISNSKINNVKHASSTKEYKKHKKRNTNKRQ
jgi:hypothetical protein